MHRSSVGYTDLSFLRRNPICELHLSRALPSRGLILLNQLCVSNGTVIISHFYVGDWVDVVSNCTMGMLWAMNFEQFYFVFFCFLLFVSDKLSDIFELVLHPADEHGQRKYDSEHAHSSDYQLK